MFGGLVSDAVSSASTQLGACVLRRRGWRFNVWKTNGPSETCGERCGDYMCSRWWKSKYFVPHGPVRVIITCDRPSKSKNAGGGGWDGGKVCLVLTQTYRYTLDMHPSLRFHDCRLWLSVSDRRMPYDATVTFVYTFSNSWSNAWTLPALKDRTMRDHQSLMGAFSDCL